MNAWLETSFGVRIPVHGACTIGRSPKNSLVLSDKAASRRHALIHPQGAGEHWLVDLGSSNGIQLNGGRVTQPVRLKDQDRLEIVGNVFLFRQLQPAPEEWTEERTTFLTAREPKPMAIWLLLAQIEKPAQLSQTLPVQEFSQLIGGWFLACKGIVEKHRGVINKYLGEGFLACWPDADTSPTAIARMLGEFKSAQAARIPPFRLAVHYGSVSAAKAMTGHEDDLTGPEVDLVFRVGKLAASLSEPCLLSEAAAAQLRLPGDVALARQLPLSRVESGPGLYRY